MVLALCMPMARDKARPFQLATPTRTVLQTSDVAVDGARITWVSARSTVSFRHVSVQKRLIEIPFGRAARSAMAIIF